jgi:two-component system, chemotaxis family, response regulator WspF
MKIAIVSSFLSTIQRVSHLIETEQPHHHIIWTATNGQVAVNRCVQDTPDLIFMDLVMPVKDGVAATRLIMQATPCAILILTHSVHSYPETVAEAIKAGAIDVLDTPHESAHNSKQFLNKINAIERLISQRHDVFRRSTRQRCLNPASIIDRTATAITPSFNSSPSSSHWQATSQLLQSSARTPPRYLVAIGASTGGPGAVLGILRELTASFPAPIVVVQHVEDEFIPGLAAWFGKQIALPVKIAQTEDCPQMGQVLIVGGSHHLVLSTRQTLRYVEQAGMIYRPSIDLFFASLVENWPGKVIGILLTGIGWDGANGLKQLRTAGHITMAQNEKSCVVYGMPKAAVALDAAAHILAPEQMGSALKRLVS